MGDVVYKAIHFCRLSSYFVCCGAHSLDCFKITNKIRCLYICIRSKRSCSFSECFHSCYRKRLPDYGTSSMYNKQKKGKNSPATRTKQFVLFFLLNVVVLRDKTSNVYKYACLGRRLCGLRHNAHM